MDLIILLQSPLVVSLMVFALLGVLIVIFGTISRIRAKQKNILSDLSEKAKKKEDGPFDLLLNKVKYIEKKEKVMAKKLNYIDVKITARTITKIKMFIIFISALVAVYFKNWIVFFPVFLILESVPGTIIEMKSKKRYRLYEEQILEALQIFITDYTTQKSVRNTLTNIGSKLNYPIKKEFETVARNLNAGKPEEEVFTEFSEKLQNKWITIFSQLMITYFRSGGDFVPHLLTVTQNISSEKVLNEKNTTELSSLRFMNILTNALVPLAYITNIFINKENSRIFIDTGSGQMILFMVLCSCFVSLFLGKKITQS